MGAKKEEVVVPPRPAPVAVSGLGRPWRSCSFFPWWRPAPGGCGMCASVVFCSSGSVATVEQLHDRLKGTSGPEIPKLF